MSKQPKYAKPKLLISNLAYGATYAKLFLDNHLKSVLDSSNLPEIAKRYDVTYMLFTDDETTVTVSRHPNFMRLGRIIGSSNVDVRTIAFPPEVQRYDARYAAQVQTFQIACAIALETGAIFSSWAADLVIAKEFLPRVVSRIEAGHDAVLCTPVRGTAECLHQRLENAEGALPDRELFAAAYSTMHPLWIAAHVDSPTFTRLPYAMLWNSGKGLINRGFSVSPIIFRPCAEMLKSERVIDSEIMTFTKNPYWATDWTDAPMIGAEPINCFYPPWDNARIDLRKVAAWTKEGISPSQRENILTPFYYPNRAECGFPEDEPSALIATQILNHIREQSAVLTHIPTASEYDDQALPVEGELR